MHGSETWPVRKENVVALQRAEMRMVRWMCGLKLKDRLPSKELRERLDIDDIALVLPQNRLRWYGHLLRKDDDDWVKECMEYEVEGSRPRGRPRLPSKELRERQGVDDIALILQQNRLRWYGHELRKDDWVKKYMEHEVEGSRPRGRPKRTWKEVVREDCETRKLNKEDAVHRCKWRKVIKEVR